jgi:AAA domain-containing protein
MSQIATSALKGTSLEAASSMAPTHSLIVDIYGPPGSGKSHFALTAPGPVVVALFGAKNELEGVAEKFTEKQVLVGRYVDASEQTFGGKSDNTEHFGKQNKQMEKDVMTALKAGARTAVIDKQTDWWEAIRFEYFGMAATTSDFHRSKANSEWSRQIRQIVELGKNLILISEEQDEWGPSSEIDEKTGKPKRQPTGRKIRKGNERTGYLVDVTLRAFRQKDKFYTEIVQAKKNPLLDGTVHEGLDFSTLAMMVKPTIPAEVWF